MPITHSNLIFKIRKIVKIIIKARNKDSCCPSFRLLKILPLYSQYIFSILIFVVKNLDIFKVNSDIHTIHTYGWLPLSLKFDLHRDIMWRFVMANVT
jgi:hypothetical protein